MPDLELAAPLDVQTVQEFGSFRSPDHVIKEAELVAKAFGKKAEQLQLYKKIGESKHLQIEGWQLLASMYRVTAGVKSTNFVQFGDAQGFEAVAEAIYVPTGRVISTAEAMCLNDEDKWGAVTKYEWQDDPEQSGKQRKVAVGYQAKPLQQLRSMAQTRACSKVLSNLLKFVAKMAGFSGTPVEELHDSQFPEHSGNGNNNISEPQRRAPSGHKISEPQRKRLWAIAKSANKSNDDVIAVLKRHGFERSEEVTSDKYEAICSEVQRSQPTGDDAAASA